MNNALHKYPVEHPLLQKYIKFFWEIESEFMQLNHHIIPVRNVRIKMRGPVHVLGICFFPEGFYPFLKMPVSECKNQLLGAGEAALFPTKTMHERLMEAPDIVARLNILEHELISRLDEKIKPPESFRHSAKTYHMLDRFQDSLNQLLYSDYSKLSDIAYGNEYFDQMHFIRDFKRFTGSSPTNFIRQDNFMVHAGKPD